MCVGTEVVLLCAMCSNPTLMYVHVWSCNSWTSNKLPIYLWYLHLTYLLSPSVGSQAVHASSLQRFSLSLQSSPGIHKTPLSSDIPSINNLQPHSETVTPADAAEDARQLRELENSRM